MKMKNWFEYLKTIQDIAKAVPKGETSSDPFWIACKEKLCNLSLSINNTGYNLIDADVADHIIKEYQEIK